jgi:hypothetical protein
MNDIAPQNPFFKPVIRHHKTEEELDATIEVVTITVYGEYTKRGQHRKEVVTEDYEFDVEVPKDYNVGHVKLAVNRHVRRKLKGIRARTYHVDQTVDPKPVEHKRRVRDFISERGMRTNLRQKRDYDREMAKRKAEADHMAAGQVPSSYVDDSEYGTDGLPKFSDRTYVAQE